LNELEEKIAPGDASECLALKNLEFLVRVTGKFRPSRFLEMRGCVCCDTGTDSESENYALIDPDRASRDVAGARTLVHEALDFFAVTGRPHTWYISDRTPGVVVHELERAGIRWSGKLTAMTADVKDETADDARDIGLPYELKDTGEAREWADAVWFGFDSGCPAPASFAVFAEEMRRASEIMLFASRAGISRGSSSKIAATGLLITADSTAGIYYVSTLPDFRQRGLGMSMMKAMMKRSRAAGCGRITLLATSSGYPLYRRCGFQACGDIAAGVLGER
jgi:ribosomal protein S18 acetylase RimI-like enzyme